MPAPNFQHQTDCSPPFPPRDLSTQYYEMTTLDEYEIYCSESLANVVDAQYNELGECHDANQIRNKAVSNLRSRCVNAVPDTKEQSAPTWIESSDLLEIPYRGIALSRTARLCPFTYPDTALQSFQQQQDCSSSPATSLVRHNGIPPWPDSQPVCDPLLLPSDLPKFETVALKDHDLKRLRNTAASARFRAKKRVREERLERCAREKKEKLTAMEEKMRRLEMENKWLRSLAIGKCDSKGDIEFVGEAPPE